MRPGERILWSGGPDPARHLTGKDWFLIPFSLLWGGFAVFWLIQVLGIGAPIYFIVFGSVFAFVGVYFVIGRFLVKSARKRRTGYFVTNQRAVIRRGSGSLEDVSLRNAPISTQRSARGDHATVTMGYSGDGVFQIWNNTGMDVLFIGSGFAFYDVKDPEPMLRALECARDDGREQGSDR